MVEHNREMTDGVDGISYLDMITVLLFAVRPYLSVCEKDISFRRTIEINNLFYPTPALKLVPYIRLQSVSKCEN